MSKTNGAKQIDTRAASHCDYLTPLALLSLLGQFDLDPCCPKKMPWRTAKTMIHLPANGLAFQWKGRVWLNPPYDKSIGLWLEKIASHGNGLALVPAKATETRWGQAALAKCSAAYFLFGRLLFLRPDGTETNGKLMGNMLLAYGNRNIGSLCAAKFVRAYPGVLMAHI